METTMEEVPTDAIKIRFDSEVSFLEVNVDKLQDQEWSGCLPHINQIEKFVLDHQEMTILFTCKKPSNMAMRFVMTVLKMVEQHQWREHKELRIYWNFDVGKSYRDWLETKLRRYFDLNINLSRSMQRKSWLG